MAVGIPEMALLAPPQRKNRIVLLALPGRGATARSVVANAGAAKAGVPNRRPAQPAPDATRNARRENRGAIGGVRFTASTRGPAANVTERSNRAAHFRSPKRRGARESSLAVAGSGADERAKVDLLLRRFAR